MFYLCWFKLEALKAIGPTAFEDKYALLDETLCEKDGAPFHSLQCIERQCDDCGIIDLESSLLEVKVTLKDAIINML